MSNDNIPFKDIENIKLLMRKRKKILSTFGKGSPQFKKIENDTKFIFTANKINSILISITITFFLFRKIPTTPIVKITAPSVR